MSTRNYDTHVEQLRTALHHSPGSRATLMVGAGFSRNASKRIASAKDFPSWPALTESLVERLYPNDIEARTYSLRNAGATSGALRIAQEFEAAFGRTVLMNHLRAMMPDQEHEPGVLHRDLLNLPWSDVFTTNYDTLLERAARPLREQRYEVVRCVDELPLKRAPRIIKLHGTLPELSHCILTEEDFRKYSELYGPLVAEMQVAMVETHLCLIGFSGDDPNFLAWSGWVRDRLGKHALPVYLCTFTEPSAFQSRMFEERSIFHLPLLSITGKKDYEEALGDFLAQLKRPLARAAPEWCLPRYLRNETITQEPKVSRGDKERFSQDRWIEAALAWHGARSMYPRWCIPHMKAIDNLWAHTHEWAGRAEENPPELAALTEPTAVFVAHELLWRLRTAIFPAYDGLMLNTWKDVVEKYSTWRSQCTQESVIVGATQCMLVSVAELDMAVIEIRLECLRHARETGDFTRFNAVRTEMEAGLKKFSREQREYVLHFLSYQVALFELAHWRDRNVAKLLSEWDTSAAPLWALRRAGLLIEVGDRHSAETILIQALQDLRAMADDGTPETWSIESWIIYNLRFLDRTKRFFTKSQSLDDGEDTETAIPSERSSVIPGQLNLIDYHLRDRQARPPHGSSGYSKMSVDLKDTLAWLRQRSCDPGEIVSWLEGQNGREYTRGQKKVRLHSFDARRWQSRISFASSDSNHRLVAAYRTLRLVEEAGIPLRSENVTFAGPLVESAVRFLAEREASEATGAVLRSRDAKLLKEWFSRERIATLPADEIQRLLGIALDCVRRLAQRPESLDRTRHEVQHFEAAAELLSRVVVRADDPTRWKLLCYCMTLPVALRIWERWWLVDDIELIVRRLCDGLSPSFVLKNLSTLLTFPVPGSKELPAFPNHVSWSDPVTVLYRHEKVTAQGYNSETDSLIHSAIKRVASIGADPTHKMERRYLILRLITLVNCGLLNEKLKQELAEAMYSSCESDAGFPQDTGCLDSAVLLLPPTKTVDERSLFVRKYVTTPWPSESHVLHNLLSSLARTRPVSEGRSDERLRGVEWSQSDLDEIATRCKVAIENQAQSLTAPTDSHPLRRMFPGPDEWGTAVVEAVGDVVAELLLQSDQLHEDSRDSLVAPIQTASRGGLPLLHVFPKLATMKVEYLNVLELEIISRLSSGDGERREHGLVAVNHWANNAVELRIANVSDVVVSAVTGLLDSTYFEGLIHVLDTMRNLLDRLSEKEAAAVVARGDRGLRIWCHALLYDSQNQHADAETELRSELPDLRAALTRLCTVAQGRNCSTEITRKWIEAVRDDPMPEVRSVLNALGG